jgi:hypothetical protein
VLPKKKKEGMIANLRGTIIILRFFLAINIKIYKGLML